MAAITAETIASSLPGTDPRLVAEHLARMDARYFERFALPEVARHCEGLAALGPERTATVQVRVMNGGDLACTVLAFDHPGAFSLIVGVLSSLGFDISSGDIFTWSTPLPDTPRTLEMRRKRIIDHFTGTRRRRGLERCLGAGIHGADRGGFRRAGEGGRVRGRGATDGERAGGPKARADQPGARRPPSIPCASRWAPPRQAARACG